MICTLVENYQLNICERMDKAKQRWNHLQHLCIFIISAYLFMIIYIYIYIYIYKYIKEFTVHVVICLF